MYERDNKEKGREGKGKEKNRAETACGWNKNALWIYPFYYSSQLSLVCPPLRLMTRFQDLKEAAQSNGTVSVLARTAQLWIVPFPSLFSSFYTVLLWAAPPISVRLSEKGTTRSRAGSALLLQVGVKHALNETDSRRWRQVEEAEEERIIDSAVMIDVMPRGWRESKGVWTNEEAETVQCKK